MVSNKDWKWINKEADVQGKVVLQKAGRTIALDHDKKNYKSGSLEANYDEVRGGSRLCTVPPA